MIASYLYNFIFIKTKKTAGTTVEVALADICGPDDIITPLGRHDELVRGNGKPLCRNYTSDPAVEAALMQALIAEDERRYVKARQKCEFYAHMKAAAIKQTVAPEFWDSAYKFTVERHPYEKAVSGAYFKYRAGRHPEFTQYLDTYVREGNYGSFEFYSIDGKPVVDGFLRQETLVADLKRVGAKLGFPVPDELRRMKTTSRKDTRPAREILSEAQRDIVFERCAQEFELLGFPR
jgi:hypothetical protein